MTDESLYLDLDRTQNGFGFAAEDDMLMNLDGDSFLRDASLILDTTITAAPSSTKAHNADIYARTSRVMHGEKAPEAPAQMNDMFQRRQRDSYLQKGLKLSSSRNPKPKSNAVVSQIATHSASASLHTQSTTLVAKAGPFGRPTRPAFAEPATTRQGVNSINLDMSKTASSSTSEAGPSAIHVSPYQGPSKSTRTPAPTVTNTTHEAGDDSSSPDTTPTRPTAALAAYSIVKGSTGGHILARVAPPSIISPVKASKHHSPAKSTSSNILQTGVVYIDVDVEEDQCYARAEVERPRSPAEVTTKRQRSSAALQDPFLTSKVADKRTTTAVSHDLADAAVLSVGRGAPPDLQRRLESSTVRLTKPVELDAPPKPVQPKLKSKPVSSMGPPQAIQRPSASIAKPTSGHGSRPQQGPANAAGPSDVRDKLQSVLTRLLEPRLSALTLDSDPLPLVSATSDTPEPTFSAPTPASMAAPQRKHNDIPEHSLKASLAPAPIPPTLEPPPTVSPAPVFPFDVAISRATADPRTLPTALLRSEPSSEALSRSSMEGRGQDLDDRSTYLSALEVPEAQRGGRIRVQRLTSAVKASSASIRAVQQKIPQIYQVPDTSSVFEEHTVLNSPISVVPDRPLIRPYSPPIFDKPEPISAAASEFLEEHTLSPPKEIEQQPEEQAQEEDLRIEDDVIVDDPIIEEHVEFPPTMRYEPMDVPLPDPTLVAPTNTPPPRPPPTRTNPNASRTNESARRTVVARPSRPVCPQSTSRLLEAKERAQKPTQPSKAFTARPVAKAFKAKPFNGKTATRTSQDGRAPLAQLQSSCLDPLALDVTPPQLLNPSVPANPSADVNYPLSNPLVSNYAGRPSTSSLVPASPAPTPQPVLATMPGPFGAPTLTLKHQPHGAFSLEEEGAVEPTCFADIRAEAPHIIEKRSADHFTPVKHEKTRKLSTAPPTTALPLDALPPRPPSRAKAAVPKGGKPTLRTVAAPPARAAAPRPVGVLKPALPSPPRPTKQPDRKLALKPVVKSTDPPPFSVRINDKLAETNQRPLARLQPNTQPVASSTTSEVPRPLGFDHWIDNHSANTEREPTKPMARKSSAHGVPDFARLHQTHAQKVAARIQRIKASARMTVPASPHLSTKHRAKKRAVFDAALAHKERITIRLREEQRKKDAEQQEVETKELRKRLDEGVKANPIPSFYDERPRKEV